ncbi:hypothetical protein ANAPC5_01363 [Anaplasma phagocytophilum]|nr:hypothetical protein ANAPC5_01363 [Anaplasma phagocytophilum]
MKYVSTLHELTGTKAPSCFKSSARQRYWSKLSFTAPPATRAQWWSRELAALQSSLTSGLSSPPSLNSNSVGELVIHNNNSQRKETDAHKK